VQRVFMHIYGPGNDRREDHVRKPRGTSRRPSSWVPRRAERNTTSDVTPRSASCGRLYRTPASSKGKESLDFSSESERIAAGRKVVRRSPCFSDICSIWMFIYGRNFSATCKMCGCERIELPRRIGQYAWEISHIVPVSRGGGNELSNLRPLCVHCNRSMSKMTFQEYIRRKYPSKFEELMRDFRLS
jgi:hypothetical protein